MRGVIAKFGPRCFFCNLEGHFKSEYPQFWDAVADIKHPRHDEALSGVKASKARLLSEAEARRKKTAGAGNEEDASGNRRYMGTGTCDCGG